ncbi:MAG TPA: hypothetical protein VKV16_07960 [Solirubrobacteraceae bacterium]|nr:hypothetical protein [Solirubrobacteraceae bacterium]
MLVATLVCALLACAPSAVADVGEKIVLRCTHHESLSGFTPADYRKALGELEADTEEYSDCAQRIRQAEEAAATRALGGGGAGLGGPGGGAAAFVPVAATPAQQRAIARAEHAHPAPVALAGHVIDPGVVHADIASAFSTLPTPLLAMLAFLLACLLLVCGGALRNRVRGRADAD